MFGNLLNLFGYGILLVLFLMSSLSIADSWGGAEAMINETATNATFRDSFIWHHFAFDMITPLYPVEVGPWRFNLALDDGGFLFVILISFTLSVFLTRLVLGIGWLWLLVVFPGMLLLVGFLWQNYWLSMYFETGYNLGLANEDMLGTLEDTKAITDNFWMLAMSVFTMFFLLFKGKGLFRT